MKYSKELIDRFKKEFKEKNGVEFTDEEANEALDNMAGLYLAFSLYINESFESPIL